MLKSTWKIKGFCFDGSQLYWSGKLQTVVCAVCCCSDEFPVFLVHFIKDYQ